MIRRIYPLMVGALFAFVLDSFWTACTLCLR